MNSMDKYNNTEDEFVVKDLSSNRFKSTLNEDHFE